MTRLKICGITREEDARIVAALGAWAMGFVFYAASKRFVPVDQARRIVSVLPAGTVLKTGVFVNEDAAEVLSVARALKLDMIQLHGDETPEMCAHVRKTSGVPLIKAFRPSDLKDIETIGLYARNVDFILIDACVDGAYGGTGARADWALALKAKAFGVPLILSGGLTPETVREAQETVAPFACDISSGVEAAPGLKDAAKLKALFP